MNAATTKRSRKAVRFTLSQTTQGKRALHKRYRPRAHVVRLDYYRASAESPAHDKVAITSELRSLPRVAFAPRRSPSRRL
jgi:hypothetical protein